MSSLVEQGARHLEDPESVEVTLTVESKCSGQIAGPRGNCVNPRSKRVQQDALVYGKPWRDRQIPGQRCRAGIRDSGSMMDQTSQKIRAIRGRLRNLLVLLIK